jgi:hypothetical protein
MSHIRFRAAERDLMPAGGEGAIMDVIVPQIPASFAEFPEMPSTLSWSRSAGSVGRRVLFERVQALRPLFRPVGPAWRALLA